MTWRCLIILHCFIYYVCGETNYTAERMTSSMLADDRTKFAFQVSLRRKGVHYCGGGIVNEFNIITSAQCCFDKNSYFTYKIPAMSIEAVAGDLKLNTPLTSTQTRKVACVLPHPHFNKDTLHNDIALMRVKKAWLFTPYVKAVGASIAPGLPNRWWCVAGGWGAQDGKDGLSEDLMYYWADQNYPEDCKETFGNDIKPGMFCAGVIDRKQGPARADRGAPLVCPENKLVGVATGTTGFVGRALYTGAVFHSRWLEKQKKLKCPFELWMIVAITIAVVLVFLAIGIVVLVRHFKKHGEEEEEEDGGEDGGDEEED